MRYLRGLLTVVAVMLTAGCVRRPLLTPEVDVRPNLVAYGAHFSVRLYGAEVGDYRFMGAVPGPDGMWIVRIDPVLLGVWNQPASIAVRQGEVLPLGPAPSVMVQFVEITSSQLILRATEVHIPTETF